MNIQSEPQLVTIKMIAMIHLHIANMNYLGQYEVETAWRSASSDRIAKKPAKNHTSRVHCFHCCGSYRAPASVPTDGQPTWTQWDAESWSLAELGNFPICHQKVTQAQAKLEPLISRSEDCTLQHHSHPLGLHTPYPRDVHADHLCLIPAFSLKKEYW